MTLHVIAEAERCLLCKKPLCVEGCPVSTPIPDMIRSIREGKMKEAGKFLFENNPLSAVCAMICDHQKQCEGHCVQGRKGKAIHISSIESYISESYLEQVEISKKEQNGLMVAVIGAGPAGMTIAIEMAKKGYSVTIFDANDKIGGIMRYAIPDFRLPKTLLDKYENILKRTGIMIRPNTTIGGALGISDLLRDGYKAIFIGTGVWRPKKLSIPGESLGNVHFAIDYLKNPDSYDLGDTVAIIGMGNTAIDVARTLLRKGVRNVTLFARRHAASANEEELEYAKLDGAQLVFGKHPIQITKQGPVMVENIFDEEGNIIGEKEEKTLFPADSTIIAVSQGPKSKIVDTTEGLKTAPSGLLLTDDDGETTLEGVFAAGDVVLGAKTVVDAVSYAKKAAEHMDKYIQDKIQHERQDS